MLGSEVCGTSITSQGPPQAEYDRRTAGNPQIHYARSDRRGYCLLTLGREARIDLRAVASEKRRDADIQTLASFAIEDGRPGLRRA